LRASEQLKAASPVALAAQTPGNWGRKPVSPKTRKLSQELGGGRSQLRTRLLFCLILKVDHIIRLNRISWLSSAQPSEIAN